MDALEGIKKLASDVNSAASTCKEYAETIEMAAAAARPFISILETDAARLHDLGFERLLNDAGVQAIAGVIPYVSAFIAVCKLGGLFGDDSSERKTVAAINSVKGDISRLATLIGLQHRYVDEHITENRVADHVDGIAGKMNQLWLDIRNNRISDFVQYAKDNDLHRHVFYTSLGALTPFDTAPEWHTLPVPAAYYSNPWTGALVPKPEPDGSWWCYTYALPALIYLSLIHI